MEGADNGQEAIKTYLQRKDEFDMVISDMIMPKMGVGEISHLADSYFCYEYLEANKL